VILSDQNIVITAGVEIIRLPPPPPHNNNNNNNNNNFGVKWYVLCAAFGVAMFC
jgi:hypothetical protein